MARDAAEEEGLRAVREVVEHGVDTDGAALAAQEPTERVGGEGASDIRQAVRDNAVEKVHVPDLVVLNHIPHEGRVVDAAEISHGRLPPAAEVPQARKAPKGKVVLEKLLVRRRRPFRCGEVETTQCPILGEGERLNVNLDVPAGEVSGEVPGEHPGVGPCQVDIAVPIHPQRIDDPLPARNLLYLVEEEVGTRSAVRRLGSEVVEQLLGSADGQADGGLEVEPDRLGSWMVLADLLSDKVEDGGLSAAAHSGEDLDDRGVGVWRDAVGVARARNNLVGLGHGILPSTTIDKVGLIAILIDHSRQTSHLFPAPSRLLTRHLFAPPPRPVQTHLQQHGSELSYIGCRKIPTSDVGKFRSSDMMLPCHHPHTAIEPSRARSHRMPSIRSRSWKGVAPSGSRVLRVTSRTSAPTPLTKLSPIQQ